MKNTITNIARKLAYAGITMASVLCITTSAVGATPDPLSLAQSPLFIGSSVPPNVMVAVDNSGTMDLETLFPTDAGMLYWDTDRWTGAVGELLNGVLKSTAGSNDNNFGREDYNNPTEASNDEQLVPYGYLFPNGCNKDGSDGRRVYCKLSGEQSGLLGDTFNLLGLPSPINNPDVSLVPLLLGDNHHSYTISAVPPIPQFGFARSPKYNKSYFDPNVTYKPWPGDNYSNAPIDAAPSDPAVTDSPKFKLTAPVRKGAKHDESFWRFRVDSGMTIPKGTEITFGPLLDLPGDTKLEDLVNGIFAGIGGVASNLTDGLCGVLNILGLCPSGLLNSVVGILGNWHTLTSDWIVGESPTKGLLGLDNCSTGLLGLVSCNKAVTKLLNNLTLPADLGIKYYPATFYLEPLDGNPPSSKQACKNLLPAGYAGQVEVVTKPDGAIQLGDDPAGNALMCGFEIQNTSDGTAIQNFANWFSYYRKRHLAVQGGLATALTNTDGDLNVGIAATNNVSDENGNAIASADIAMRSRKDELSDLYSKIYDMPFYKPLGAPNRGALKYLGDQFDRDGDKQVITQSCQQNYAMLVTDGYNTGKVSGIDNADAAGTEKGYETGQLNPAFTDEASNTIADVAMHYYLDLPKPDGIDDGNVPVPDACDTTDSPLRLDCNKNPHMVTSAVTLDQRGLIYNNPNTPDPYDTDNTVNWDSIAAQQAGLAQIDDLWHATVNSRGKMLNAKTPADIVDSFKSILNILPTGKGSATDLATESRNLLNDPSNGQLAFQASFTSGDWHGELVARTTINQAGELSANPKWSAAKKLANRNLQTDPRTILTTGDDDSPETFDDSATDLYLSDDAINYIRGDQSNEQANDADLRNRGGDILGDIVHSTPLFVGAPDRDRYPAKWIDNLLSDKGKLDETNYRSFANKRNGTNGTARMPMVYVGANDGMLHGFNANTGEEELAYVPHGVLSKLVALTKANYAVGNHQFYVDGSPASGDIFFGGGWHTVLVGGLRAGGRGVYALDVTDPGSFSKNDVLWDLTRSSQNDGDEGNMGHVYGKPSIVRLHDGKWAAIFGNGYNSPKQSAGLYIVEFGAEGIKPTTTFIPAKTGHDTNGLSQVFPVDLGGDFITDYVYAGDLHGNLWRFDLTGETRSVWKNAKPTKPIFKAKDDVGNAQPITTQPQVGAHPYGLDYGVMVYFGTGKYLENSDRDSTPENTFYGIWDPGISSTVDQTNHTFKPAFSSGVTEATRGNLVPQDIKKQTSPNANDNSLTTNYRAVSDEPVIYPSKSATGNSASLPEKKYHHGWYLDLVPPNDEATGERVVTNAQLHNGERGRDKTVAFSTLIPGDPAVCGPSGGGFFMVLNQLNGGRTQTAPFLSSPKLNVKATASEKQVTVDASGIRMKGGIPGMATHQTNRRKGDAYYIVPTSNGKTTTIPIPLLGKDGRVSWREIRQ